MNSGGNRWPEVAAKLKTSVAEVDDLKQLVRTHLFTRQPDQRPAGHLLRDVIEDRSVLRLRTTEGVMRRAELMAWVNELPERNATVILARFGLDGAESRTLKRSAMRWG